MIRRTLVALLLTAFAVVMVIALRSNHSYVTTPSMYPTIPPGSEIVVRPERSYHVGQVIEFHANGMTWAHRIIKIDANGHIHTKGDNPQNSPDVFLPPLTQADVVGAVVHAPRWVGFPELILNHPAYGLSWLRTELGVRGKLGAIGLVAVVGLSAAAVNDRRRTARRARHHRRATAHA